MSNIKDAIRDQLSQAATALKWRRSLEAFRLVYEKTDRILSGEPVKVALEATPPHSLREVPGWTDGETITLNAHVMSKGLRNLPMSTVIVQTKGMNYHELCHVLYTPRYSDDICKWIRQEMQTLPYRRHLWHGFNILEDQRIETMFAAQYRPVIPYFEAIALTWLIKNPSATEDVFPLIYGRKFLSSEVRDAAEAAFVAKHGEELADNFRSIIDRYNRIAFPGDTLRAQSLVDRFALLLEQMSHTADLGNLEMSADNGGKDGVSNNDDDTKINKGLARSKTQKEAIEKIDDLEDDLAERSERRKEAIKEKAEAAEATEADDEGDEADGSSDVDDGSDDGEGASPSLTEELMESVMPDGASANDDDGDDADDQAGESDAQGEATDADTDDGSGTGHGGEDDRQTAAQEAAEAFLQALEEVFNDEDFMTEVSGTVSAIKALLTEDGGTMADGSTVKHQEVNVPVEAIQSARVMEEHFRRLRTQLDEERFTRQTAGTIDLKRWANRQPWEVDFFQSYDPGSYDEMSIDVVLVVDLSGSMSHMMGELSTSLWMCKRAFEAVEAKVTVLGYSDDGYVLYQSDEHVQPNKMKLFPAINGTEPMSSLHEAFRLLYKSTATTKIMVSLTDGQWWADDNKLKTLMGAMESKDILTAMLYLSSSPPYNGGDRHHHKLYKHISSARGLASFSAELVEESLRQSVMAQAI